MLLRKRIPKLQKERKKVKNKILYFIILCSTFSFAQFYLDEAFSSLSFSSPVDLQRPDDGTNRIFIVEQQGIIKVFNNDISVSSAKTFLNISDSVLSGGELGLLGLAFHPDFKNNGYFFVDYTKNNPRRTVISRFKISNTNPDSADRNSEVILIEQSQPYSNHNGGQIAFGPDGYLYIGFGDGGSGGDPENRAQNLKTFLGKILRIDVNSANGNLNYSIPSTNPFINNINALDEIYAYGLRNPWRFSFDISTGTLWCGDVGQNLWEEIDTIKSGGNYGWRIMEGNHCYNPSNCSNAGLELPIWEYSHSSGNCSVTGGYVYRGDQSSPIYGKYIYGDYCSASIWALSYTGINPNSPVNDFLFKAPSNILSFGTDANNDLYVLCANGKIYKFVFAPNNVDDKNIDPNNYYLLQNYPNPFNPSTKISYNIPERSRVKIQIADVLGKIVATIEDTVKSKGFYETNWNAAGNTSGIYYIRIKAESLNSKNKFDKSIKAVFLK